MEWAPEASGPGKRHQFGGSSDGAGCFFPDRTAVCKFSRTCLSLLESPLCSTWTTTFSSLWWCGSPRKRRRQRQHPEIYGSTLELGLCSLSFNPHVVKIISVVLSCLFFVTLMCTVQAVNVPHLFDIGSRLTLSCGILGCQQP